VRPTSKLPINRFPDQPSGFREGQEVRVDVALLV